MSQEHVQNRRNRAGTPSTALEHGQLATRLQNNTRFPTHAPTPIPSLRADLSVSSSHFLIFKKLH